MKWFVNRINNNMNMEIHELLVHFINISSGNLLGALFR